MGSLHGARKKLETRSYPDLLGNGQGSQENPLRKEDMRFINQLSSRLFASPVFENKRPANSFFTNSIFKTTGTLVFRTVLAIRAEIR